MSECEQHGVFNVPLHLLIPCKVVPIQLVISLVWLEHCASKTLKLCSRIIVILWLLVANQASNIGRVVRLLMRLFDWPLNSFIILIPSDSHSVGIRSEGLFVSFENQLDIKVVEVNGLLQDEFVGVKASFALYASNID